MRDSGLSNETGSPRSKLTSIVAALLLVLILISQALGRGILLNASNLQSITNFLKIESGDEVAQVATAPESSLQARVLAQLNSSQAEQWLHSSYDDRDALNQFELCILQWGEGRINEAVTACQAGNVPAIHWTNLGLTFTQTGNHEQAVAAYEMAVIVDPTFAEGWYRLAREQFSNKSYAEASISFETALELGFSPEPGLFSEMGRAYLEQQDSAGAISSFEMGLALFPETQFLMSDLAMAYRAAGDNEAAARVYEDMLVIWPEEARVWALRGELALTMQEAGVALSNYEKAVTFAPENASYWYALALSAEQSGSVEQASNAYEQAVALATDNPNILYQAATFFAQQGQTERAIALLEQLLERRPDFAQAQELLAKLEN